MLLLAGGTEDPQIAHLKNRAESRGLDHLFLDVDDSETDFFWDVRSGLVKVRNEPLNVASVFLRQNVFRYLRTKDETDSLNAQAWKGLLDGYIWANSSLRVFNRRFVLRSSVNKPLALAWALEAGLDIPRTQIHVSRQRALDQISEHATVYKPVTGGGYCQVLGEDILSAFPTDRLPRPYIYQERLLSPEVRIFRVGEKFLAFRIESVELDYRSVDREKIEITQIPPPADLVEPLRKLLDRIGLNFSAVDFKTSSDTGTLCFLEANSNPMFAAFDQVSDHALCDAMLDWLTA